MKKLLVLFVLINLFAVTFGQKRIVLLESFTSSTCPPCVPANSYIDNWLTNPTNKSSVAVIKYHVWWPAPGNDPFYLENTVDVQNRRTYYAVPAVPYGYVDGVNYSSNYSAWTAAIKTKTGIAANLKLSIAKGSNINEAAIKVESLDAQTIQDLTLHAVLVESKLNYTGTNGDPVHNYVMRKMYPNYNGETFTIKPKENLSFNKTIIPNSTWNKSNLALVAFIQQNSTKTILQAVMIDYSVLTSVKQEDEVPESFALMQNFPNPFNPETTISYSVTTPSNVSLKVYDVLGKEVAALVDEYRPAGTYNSQFSIGNYQLTSGIYFYTLKAGGFAQTKKMILAK